jgi:hypothetical protein
VPNPTNVILYDFLGSLELNDLLFCTTFSI